MGKGLLADKKIAAETARIKDAECEQKIEQAVEKERERIIKILNHCKVDWFGDEDNPDWIQAAQFSIEAWQSLKGE
uniref:Uncharacterized protein n=1 Tax=viral metagenome TaxID=1070528 RepID=A0A6H2A4E8_9ZZZZ